MDEVGKGLQEIERIQYVVGMVDEAWANGSAIPDKSPDVWREDRLGNRIRREDYGNATSEFGWVLVHIKPLGEGGTDYSSNPCPLRWDVGREKAGPEDGRRDNTHED